jgi:predicted transcriptional regulator YdeE
MRRILYLRALRVPLADIGKLLDAGRANWRTRIRAHLYETRAELRSLARVEAELAALERRLETGKEIFEGMEKKTEFTIGIMRLDEPIHVVGRAARVKPGTPEHMPTIERLISGFFGDDVPASIPRRKTPALRFGVCAEWDEATRTFTYMMGDQTLDCLSDEELPQATRRFEIEAGDYASITFAGPDNPAVTGPLLGEGYKRLFDWLKASDQWESAVRGAAYEVYEDERFEVPSWPEMDIITPVRRKKDGLE